MRRDRSGFIGLGLALWILICVVSAAFIKHIEVRAKSELPRIGIVNVTQFCAAALSKNVDVANAAVKIQRFCLILDQLGGMLIENERQWTARIPHVSRDKHLRASRCVLSLWTCRHIQCASVIVSHVFQNKSHPLSRRLPRIVHYSFNVKHIDWRFWIRSKRSRSCRWLISFNNTSWATHFVERHISPQILAARFASLNRSNGIYSGSHYQKQIKEKSEYFISGVLSNLVPKDPQPLAGGLLTLIAIGVITAGLWLSAFSHDYRLVGFLMFSAGVFALFVGLMIVV
jgi:hypothetical protein